MINEGKIVASGPPPEIIRKVLPDQPDADLNRITSYNVCYTKLLRIISCGEPPATILPSLIITTRLQCRASSM